MTQIEDFKKGIHSRPFSNQLKAYSEFPQVEWDYGGKLTSVINISTTDQWPVKIGDISSWQGEVDFKKLATQVQVVILRAMYGLNSVDTKLDTYYRGAKDNGIEVMLYHYMKPNLDWLTQVNNFIGLEKNYPALAMWGDLEENGGLNKLALDSWAYKYFTKLVGYKNRNGIYSSAGFMNGNMNNPALFSNMNLWVAAWTTASYPILPIGFSMYELWQWSSKGNGSTYGVSSTYIDLDRSRLNIDQFNIRYGTNIQPIGGIPIPPPVESFPKKVISTTDVNVRTSPNAISDKNKIGAIPQGTILDAISLSTDPNWYTVLAYVNKNYFKDFI
jgi:GH25 family lysozyme M1 (1,4-beta-N-acetylmuramidase)